jgi:RNA polymerase sigma-70 factor (ECF subfamily)
MLVWRDVDDVQLLKIAKEGEPEAFGELYERYSQVIFRFFYANLNNRYDAEDLTEEVFLRTLRSLPKYRDQGFPFPAFLFRVAQNALVDHYRRSGRSAHDVSTDEDIQIRDDKPDPSDSATKNLQQQELRQVLEQLREDYRNVLVLRFLNDLTPEETAQVMERSVGAVRVAQHRALAALRNCWTRTRMKTKNG